MKIRFVKDILVEVQKTKIDEVWDKQYHRWDELNVESIQRVYDFAAICTAEKDILMDVPVGAFEVIED